MTCHTISSDLMVEEGPGLDSEQSTTRRRAAGIEFAAVPLDRIRIAEYRKSVIRSFADRDTERVFRDERVRRFQAIERQARRKLLQLDAASELSELRVPPGNRLEALTGDRNGQYSIRINDQWRICFRWQDGAHDVEIVDYH